MSLEALLEGRGVIVEGVSGRENSLCRGTKFDSWNVPETLISSVWWEEREVSLKKVGHDKMMMMITNGVNPVRK